MPKLVVVPIHGVSDHVLKPGYADVFFRMLVEELMYLGVIPRKTSDKKISDYIVCEEVNYSQFGQAAEDLVYNSYVESQSKLLKFWDKALNAFLFEKVRRLLVTIASDVFVYKNEDCKKLIRDTVAKTIKPYTKTGDAVSVVGHSLGAVVAFDTIYYQATAEWEKDNFLPSNLFTLGSPLLLFSLDLENECAANPEQKARFDPNVLNQKLIRADGAWLNFFDPQDVIGYPVELYFKNKFSAKDVIVGTGIDPVTAHSEYWHSQEVVSKIAERLKLDYERINATAPPTELPPATTDEKDDK